MRGRLIAMLEPVLAGLGYELVELECSSALIRVYIDRLDRAAGITVDDCELVSKQVSTVLDAEDPIAGRYTLEVSSPGLDRPLRLAAHFRAAVGQRARLVLEAPLPGASEPGKAPRKAYTGTVLGVAQGASGDEVALEVDGKTYEIPLRALSRARLVA